MIRHFIVSVFLYISIIGTALLILGIAKKSAATGAEAPGIHQKRAGESTQRSIPRSSTAKQKLSACEQFKFANCPK